MLFQLLSDRGGLCDFNFYFNN